jgi:hypothetical protein
VYNVVPARVTGRTVVALPNGKNAVVEKKGGNEAWNYEVRDGNGAA